MPTPDAYTWHARIAPAVIVVAPVLLFAATSALLTVKLALGSAALSAAGLILVSQLVRDAGKRREPTLWRSWGDAPTLQLLRWRGNQQAAVEARHAEVSAVLGGPLPTQTEEASDTAAADTRYEHAITVLAEATRQDFPLVAAENANYGFRRNLLGIKPIGVAIALATLAACVVLYLVRDDPVSDRLRAVALPVMCSILLLVVYWKVIRPEWVRVPADAYAQRLVGAASVLRRDPPPQ